MFCTRESTSSAVIKTDEKARAKDRRSAREIDGLKAGRRFMERFRFKADKTRKNLSKINDKMSKLAAKFIP